MTVVQSLRVMTADRAGGFEEGSHTPARDGLPPCTRHSPRCPQSLRGSCWRSLPSAAWRSPAVRSTSAARRCPAPSTCRTTSNTSRRAPSSSSRRKRRPRRPTRRKSEPTAATATAAEAAPLAATTDGVWPATRIPRARAWGFLTGCTPPDREEPVGGTRRRRGIFATHERCLVGHGGIL